MTTSAPIHPPAATAEQTGAVDIELAVSGMTCASCAARIERTLNKLDGVSASVNYATEKAALLTDPWGISGLGGRVGGRRG